MSLKKWYGNSTILQKVFFNDDDPIPRTSSDYKDFWLFLEKYEKFREKSGKKPSNFKRDDQSYPRYYDGRYKMEFKVSDGQLLERYRRASNLSIATKISEADIWDFKNILERYFHFVEKQKVAKLVKLRQDQENLPIKQYEEQIVYALKANQVVIVAGDTGCGKSTQVPQYLLKAGFTNIACTQPRRIACISLAKRVSYETLNEYENQVAYQVRFESSKSHDTKIIFLTEGLLLRQFQSDPTLSRYDVVVADEVHERHLNGDFLLGVLKCLLQQRNDLKLVLMSATINIDLFVNYFNNAPVIQVPGRLYPIDLQFMPHFVKRSELPGPSSEKLDPSPYIKILQLIDDKYPSTERGDVLIFMSGMSEISSVVEAGQQYAEQTKHWIILPLHSSLSIGEQDKVFDIAPNGVRKCIVSTNIAETSVTIDGVRFIVDSGKVKEMTYDPQLKMQRLEEFWVSQASAEQRKGRAGRTGPGVCFRLYSEDDYKSFADYSTPEIHRVPLDNLVLQITNLGLKDATLFPFLEPPPKSSISNSILLLRQQNALTADGELTPIGRMLARLPVDIVIGKMLIMGSLFSMIEPILVIASALSVQPPMTKKFGTSNDPDIDYRRKELLSPHGDPFTLLNVYDQWILIKADRHSNSRKWCKRRGIEEQRLYEMSKLKKQFEDLLCDHGLLKQNRRRFSDTKEKRKEREELGRLKRKLKTTTRPRKVLKLEEDLVDSEDEEKESDDEDGDLYNIEFKLRNDLTRLEASSKRNRSLTLREVNVLKLIISSGLYPQVVVPDESNMWRKESEQVFHSKDKRFLLLHPTSTYAMQPEFLQSLYQSTNHPSEQSSKEVEGRSSGSHELLTYVSLLETNKPYVVNSMKVTALQTLLLLSNSLDTNSDCTRILCNEWLELSFDDASNVQSLLSIVLQLRQAWSSLLEEKILLHEKVDSDSLKPSRKCVYLEKSLGIKLGEFIDADISYEIRRVPSADLAYTFVTSACAFPSESKPEKTSVKTTEELESSNILSKVQCFSNASPNCEKGGVYVTPYLTYGCLRDPITASIASRQAEYLVQHYHCPKCETHIVGTLIDRFHHDKTCQEEEITQKTEGFSTNAPEKEKSPPRTAFQKYYFCSHCKKEFQMTAPEILKHKLTHG